MLLRRPIWRSRPPPDAAGALPRALSPRPADPGDRFTCMLDEQPSYLVPERLLPIDPEGPLVVSPDAWLSWLPERPAWAGEHELSPDPSPGADSIGVRDPASSVPSSFTIGPALRRALGDLRPGDPAPPDLSPRHRSLLAAAGALVRPGEQSPREALWREEAAEAARAFQARGFAPLPALLHPFHLGAMRLHARRLVRTGRMQLGDSGDPRRYVLHNEPQAALYHRRLTPVVEAIAGVPVKPSYVYLTSYQSGAELRAHSDRAQCEISVTLLLDFTPEPEGASPWPLHLETEEGRVTISQRIGDALLYRGRRFVHHRAKLPAGMTSTSILFHYVDRDFDGPLD
ncbi:MAG: hypothetical protein U0359_18710 [Byssovorax sp.]